MAKKIRDIMTADVVCVTTAGSVYEVAVKMRDHNVGLIPVVDDQRKPIGVITDRDLAIRSIADKKPNSGEFSNVMTTSLITASPDNTVDEAKKIMDENNIRRILIIENDKVVGILSNQDLDK